MSQQRAKMRCPDCNVEMNRHAEKLRDPISPQDAARVDDDLGGVVAELHACPQCGRSLRRDAHCEVTEV